MCRRARWQTAGVSHSLRHLFARAFYPGQPGCGQSWPMYYMALIKTTRILLSTGARSTPASLPVWG